MLSVLIYDELQELPPEQGLLPLDPPGVALRCPAEPCGDCTGNSAVRDFEDHHIWTSWEWCLRLDTCAATVDWEALREQGVREQTWNPRR